jgi:hypothetical protein
MIYVAVFLGGCFVGSMALLVLAVLAAGGME